jgi:riboflavin synthase
MFTGLIQQMAKVVSISSDECGVRLVISCAGWDSPLEMGESICTSGCCLTVAGISEENAKKQISFDVVRETLDCTTIGSWNVGSSVNLERSLRPDSLLGGHFVQGHIDGAETVLAVTEEGEGACRIRFSLLNVDSDTIVHKGSITIDGISLTIAAVGDDWFEVALVPTTLKETTLGILKIGDKVNIETDILARTVVHTIRKMQNK